MHAPEYYLLGLVQEYAVRLSVARGEDDLAVVTAIWQAPGPLALQLVLNLTAQAAITFCMTLLAARVCWCMAGMMLIWDNMKDMTSSLRARLSWKAAHSVFCLAFVSALCMMRSAPRADAHL
jgi:hypothetical protein